MKLSEALDAVVNDRLYAKSGQVIHLGQSDIPELISTISMGLLNRGHAVTSVKVKLDAEKHFVDIVVTNDNAIEKENKKTDLSLQWKDAQGNLLVMINDA